MFLRADRCGGAAAAAAGGGGGGGSDAGAGAAGVLLCRLGLTRRMMSIPTTSSRSRRRILRFVVRRW